MLVLMRKEPTVAPIMTYPPSPSNQSIEDTRTRNDRSSSSRSIRSRSLTGLNQPEPSNIVVAAPTLEEQTPPLAPTKARSKTKGKRPSAAAPDSLAMGTRSKRKRHAMGTRSKRKLLD